MQSASPFLFRETFFGSLLLRSRRFAIYLRFLPLSVLPLAEKKKYASKSNKILMLSDTFTVLVIEKSVLRC